MPAALTSMPMPSYGVFAVVSFVTWSVALQADKFKYDIQIRRTCPEG
jgi:hypothetical protein